MGKNIPTITLTLDEYRKNRNPISTYIDTSDYILWLNPNGDYQRILLMSNSCLFKAGIEVITEEFTYKDEWLKVITKELLNRKQDKRVTELMLRR